MRTAVAFALLAAWSAVNSYHVQTLHNRTQHQLVLLTAERQQHCDQAASAVRVCLAAAGSTGATLPR